MNKFTTTSISINKFEGFPDWLFTKWQEIVDILAAICEIPTALIMKTENEMMEVFISSKTAGNPYKPGDKEEWHGVYCERVIKTQKELLVSNALKDKDWSNNPDIELGMIAYYGLPINFPDNTPFGTICILDNKENKFSKLNKDLLRKFKDVIEYDLLKLYYSESEKEELTNTIYKQHQELAHLVKELKVEKEKAEVSDKLKSAFLATMSHEIRTPLNGILGFVDLITDAQYSDNEKESFADAIRRNSNRLLHTLNDIIEISQIHTDAVKVNNSSFEIRRLLLDLFTLFKPEIRNKPVELICECHKEDKARVIHADFDKLYSILSNLLKNAIKFTEKGKIVLGFKGDNRQVVFHIKDTGIGIAREDISGIFNIFQQVDNTHTSSYEGSGLGLSIAKAYVEMMGGQIWVNSEVNKGSEFYFSVPLSQA